MSSKDLTKPQKKALEYIGKCVESSGFAPTLREICLYMGYNAIGSAQDIVAALRKKGYLEDSDRQAARRFILTPSARTLLGRGRRAIVTPDTNTYDVPCLGFVPAGPPSEAVEAQIGTLRLSKTLLPRPYPRPDELFAVKATGDSMIEASIQDGDWLIVCRDVEPPLSSIVVARVEGSVTVKRLMKDPKKGLFLKPENSRLSPTYGRDHPFEIIGRVVALQRALA